MVFFIRTVRVPQNTVAPTGQVTAPDGQIYNVDQNGNLVPIEYQPEEKENPFEDPKTRRLFIRKVYLWLMLFLAITAGTIAIFVSDAIDKHTAYVCIPAGWTIYLGKLILTDFESPFLTQTNFLKNLCSC